MITVPPQMRDAGVDEMAYRKVAQQCYARMMMARGQLNMFSQRFRLENGVVITCSYCWGKQDVWISIPKIEVKARKVVAEVITGFIFHPRSGKILLMTHYRHYLDYSLGFGIYLQEPVKTNYGVVGGWSNGDTELSQSYLFPLIDGDNASMLLSDKDDEEVTVAFEQPGMYGNHYWTNGDEDSFETISWKGPPTRHGSIHHEYQIPGLSIVENTLTTLTDEIPQFTVFSPNLYRQGDVVAQAPSFSWYQGSSDTGGRSLILGAMRNTDGVTFIVTQNDHQNAPAFIWLFSNGQVRSGETESVATDYLASVNNVTQPPNPYVSVVKKLKLTKPGYFLGIWCDKFSDGAAFRTDKWELIAEFPYTGNRRAWFGNLSGTEFVCSTGDAVVINASGGAFTASYAAFEQTVGTSTQTIPSGGSRYEVAYTLASNGLKYLYEYAGDEKKSGIAVLSFSASSVQNSGEWAAPVVSHTECSPYNNFEHYVTTYTDTSMDTHGLTEYCYVPILYNHTAEDIATLPHLGFNNQLYPCDVTESERPCVGYDYNNQPMGRGVIRTLRSQGWLTEWDGELPGTGHTINTNFTLTLCGVSIPIIKTTRTFLSARTPHVTQEAEEAGVVKAWIQDSCVTQKSTIYFLDERYGVCLYKTVSSTINLPRKQSQEVSHYIAYGTTARSATIIIRPEDYTATSTETWHLVIDGIDTVVATSTLELFPFGEPMDSYAYEDVCEVFCLPKIPASSHVEPSSETNTAPAAAGDFGAYEDRYDDPFGTDAQADGGTDYFYPEWCRSLPVDQFWAETAVNRYSFTMPGITSDPAGTAPYTPPEVTVEPMPVGSFARHPVLGDMYQFLISQFNGTNIVVSSANINSFIDEQLALAKNEDGSSKGLATHDTTLYYPISLV